MMLPPRPQTIKRAGTTKAADYWALGVLIFEMLVGDPPFKSLTGDPWDTFRQAMSGRFYVPDRVSEQASDLIHKLLQVGNANPHHLHSQRPLPTPRLLQTSARPAHCTATPTFHTDVNRTCFSQKDPEKRLGAEEIKRHRWFSRIDWRALEQRQLPSPFRPRVRNPLDTSNFENFDDQDVEPPPIPEVGCCRSHGVLMYRTCACLCSLGLGRRQGLAPAGLRSCLCWPVLAYAGASAA